MTLNSKQYAYYFQPTTQEVQVGKPVPTRGGGIGTVMAHGTPIKSGFKVGSRDSETPPTGELNALNGKLGLFSFRLFNHVV